MGSNVDFEQSYCWHLVKDYLGEDGQRSFSETFIRYKFYKDFDPVAKLLVEPVPPDTKIQWQSMLTKAFSRVESTIKDLDNTAAASSIAKAMNEMIGIMAFAFTESYSASIPDPKTFMQKAIEKAREIHETKTYSFGVAEKVAAANGKHKDSPKLKICTIKNQQLLAAMQEFEDFWVYLLEIIPSRDLLFEQINSGNWKEMIVCRKDKQYAVAAFFYLCTAKEIIAFKFTHLTKVLIDENSNVFTKRIEQLSERGRNGRYADAQEAYQQVLQLIERLCDSHR